MWEGKTQQDKNPHKEIQSVKSTNGKNTKNNTRKEDVNQYRISVQVHKTQSMKVMYVLCTTATGTLAFLCEMPKSHDLDHVRGHVIRISKLPKIAKIYSVRPAVPNHVISRANNSHI